MMWVVLTITYRRIYTDNISRSATAQENGAVMMHQHGERLTKFTRLSAKTNIYLKILSVKSARSEPCPVVQPARQHQELALMSGTAIGLSIQMRLQSLEPQMNQICRLHWEILVHLYSTQAVLGLGLYMGGRKSSVARRHWSIWFQHMQFWRIFEGNRMGILRHD